MRSFHHIFGANLQKILALYYRNINNIELGNKRWCYFSWWMKSWLSKTPRIMCLQLQPCMPVLKCLLHSQWAHDTCWPLSCIAFPLCSWRGRKMPMVCVLNCEAVRSWSLCSFTLTSHWSHRLGAELPTWITKTSYDTQWLFVAQCSCSTIRACSFCRNGGME